MWWLDELKHKTRVNMCGCCQKEVVADPKYPGFNCCPEKGATILECLSVAVL